MTVRRLSVTATMLLCIDQFVAVVDEGVAVPRSARQVQPWLGGEALLGGALWALWTDGVVELAGGAPRSRPGRTSVEVQLCRTASYPEASLECRLMAALSHRREPAADLLIRTLEFTGAQPWSDLVLLVHGELAAAEQTAGAPAHVNGNTPRFLLPGLASRWDSWWSGREVLLAALARACHDALAARRQRFARGVLHGLSFAEQPRDHAEAAAAAARSRCPRWPHHL